MLHMAIKCAGKALHGSNWDRLVRFVARQDGLEYIGEPVDETQDIGAALATSLDVDVRVFSGSSVLDLSAEPTSNIRTIRCIGLNYRNHAKAMNLALPDHRTLLFKPATCLNAPNAPLVIPHQATDGQADYEAELAIVIAKHARNVRVEDALDYVLGYTCSNDVTARKHQCSGAQWGFGKGFDGFAPIGPCLVSTRRVPDPRQVVQEGRADDMIFTIPKIIAYLSQGTTIEPGTVIMTGTPHGIGVSKNPPVFLKPVDDLRIVMSHGLRSLVNYVEYENMPEGGTTSAKL
ncbi:fumarylacetoacetate hydrolase [Biscogniauxia mediterranea]|nr:fumarylacetoacetate hydrolase [Biscogniauxia mediterranea]